MKRINKIVYPTNLEITCTTDTLLTPPPPTCINALYMKVNIFFSFKFNKHV